VESGARTGSSSSVVLQSGNFPVKRSSVLVPGCAVLMVIVPEVPTESVIMSTGGM
jgi:hypothetical protein